MSSLLRKILSNRSTRVLVLLFSALLLLVTYFLLHSYFVQLDIHKEKVLSRLDAIANTTATQINGDEFEAMLNLYPEKDAIKTNEQDSVYGTIHQLLNEIKQSNQLNSEVYTLTLHEGGETFFFGVSSSNSPFYRHEYAHFPKELLEYYKEGGKMGVYEDENGHWLSAFSPIVNSQGKVVGVIQADSLFDEFIQEARSTILVNIAISLFFMFILIFLLVRSVQAILKAEDKLTQDVVQSKKVLEEKNRDIVDSIMYAKKIQDAILPEQSMIKKVLPNSFVLFKPRDIVSGDFYWFKQIDDLIIIASVDCTGHGVPGAFMSMIGSVLLEDIIAKNKIVSPHKVLDKLHSKIVKALKQDSKEADSKDGMDIALCVLNKKSKKLSYAGACRPLVFIRNNEMQRIKADSAPIGGLLFDRCYNAHEIDLQEGDAFYIFSDGYPDQFGGKNNKKYMTLKFRKFLHSISNESMDRQKEMLEEEFNKWKGNEDQVDDVLVIGFRI